MALAANNGSAALPSLVYREVKAWIAQQEAYEAHHQKPAPLTDAQHKALQLLRLPARAVGISSPPCSPPLASPAPTGPTPNYIGILLEYHQKHNLPTPTWEEQASGTLPSGVTGRVCTVRLCHQIGHTKPFPAAGYGLHDDGSAPRFTTKKQAKAFAAQCAIDWLAAQGLTTSPMPPLAAAPSQQPSLKRATQGSSSSSLSSTPSKRQTVAPAPPPPAARNGTQPASSAGGAPATELVNRLCRELGMTAPVYKIVEAGGLGSNVFDGAVVWEQHYSEEELLAVMDYSRVSGVEGKDRTKKAVAARVLEKLQEIEAERATALEGLLRKRLAEATRG